MILADAMRLVVAVGAEDDVVDVAGDERIADDPDDVRLTSSGT